MAFNGKICAISNLSQLFCWQTEIYLYNSVALGTRQVVMMMVGITDAVMMGTIGELNAVQESDINKFLNRPEDGGASDVAIQLTQILPEIVRSKIPTILSECYQAFCDKLSLTGITLA